MEVPANKNKKMEEVSLTFFPDKVLFDSKMLDESLEVSNEISIFQFFATFKLLDFDSHKLSNYEYLKITLVYEKLDEGVFMVNKLYYSLMYENDISAIMIDESKMDDFEKNGDSKNEKIAYYLENNCDVIFHLLIEKTSSDNG